MRRFSKNKHSPIFDSAFGMSESKDTRLSHTKLHVLAIDIIHGPTSVNRKKSTGRVFNFRIVFKSFPGLGNLIDIIFSLNYFGSLSNLKLKTQPKQPLGSRSFDIALPALFYFSRALEKFFYGIVTRSTTLSAYNWLSSLKTSYTLA